MQRTEMLVTGHCPDSCFPHLARALGGGCRRGRRLGRGCRCGGGCPGMLPPACPLCHRLRRPQAVSSGASARPQRAIGEWLRAGSLKVCKRELGRAARPRGGSVRRWRLSTRAERACRMARAARHDALPTDARGQPLTIHQCRLQPAAALPAIPCTLNGASLQGVRWKEGGCAWRDVRGAPRPAQRCGRASTNECCASPAAGLPPAREAAGAATAAGSWLTCTSAGWGSTRAAAAGRGEGQQDFPAGLPCMMRHMAALSWHRHQSHWPTLLRSPHTGLARQLLAAAGPRAGWPHPPACAAAPSSSTG